MKSTWIAGTLGCVLALGMLAPLCRADETNTTTVTVTGTASLRIHPQLMRMKLILNATGKDMQEALARLAEKRDAAIKALQALQPTGDVVADDPALGTDPFSVQQMQYVVLPRLKAGQSPPPVNVYTILTAEWPLPADSPDKAVIAAADLEGKIKAAIPKPGVKAKTPEEQEIAEEAQGRNDQQQPDPNAIIAGDPVFLFVRKLSEDEQTKLDATALANATRDAKHLAMAAGKTLGALHDLSFVANVSWGSPAYTGPVDMTRFLGPAKDRSAVEATGVQPGGFDFAWQVTAVYRLGQ